MAFFLPDDVEGTATAMWRISSPKSPEHSNPEGIMKKMLLAYDLINAMMDAEDQIRIDKHLRLWTEW